MVYWLDIGLAARNLALLMGVCLFLDWLLELVPQRAPPIKKINISRCLVLIYYRKNQILVFFIGNVNFFFYKSLLQRVWHKNDSLNLILFSEFLTILFLTHQPAWNEAQSQVVTSLGTGIRTHASVAPSGTPSQSASNI